MKASRNQKGLIVYGLVNTLRIYIRYNEDDSLQDNLNRLFKERNAEIEKRGLKRKNASDGGRGRNQPKQRTSDDIEDTDEGNSASDEDDDNSNSAEV